MISSGISRCPQRDSLLLWKKKESCRVVYSQECYSILFGDPSKTLWASVMTFWMKVLRARDDSRESLDFYGQTPSVVGGFSLYGRRGWWWKHFSSFLDCIYIYKSVSTRSFFPVTSSVPIVPFLFPSTVYIWPGYVLCSWCDNADEWIKLKWEREREKRGGRRDKRRYSIRGNIKESRCVLPDVRPSGAIFAAPRDARGFLPFNVCCVGAYFLLFP